jgi:hypothetical protein
MAGLITGWVLKYSPVKDPHELLVLIVLSDCAHDDGGGAFPAVDTIAERARISRRKVQYVLRDLEAAGHIEREGVTKRGTTIWRVLTARGDNFHSANWAPAAIPRPGDAQPAPVHAPVHSGAPEPSTETSEEPSIPREDGSSNAGFRGAHVTAEQTAAWQAICGRLQGQLDEFKFDTWIAPLELIELRDRRVVVGAPAYADTSVRQRYLPKITAAARAELGEDATVEVQPLGGS